MSFWIYPAANVTPQSRYRESRQFIAFLQNRDPLRDSSEHKHANFQLSLGFLRATYVIHQAN